MNLAPIPTEAVAATGVEKVVAHEMQIRWVYLVVSTVWDGGPKKEGSGLGFP